MQKFLIVCYLDAWCQIEWSVLTESMRDRAMMFYLS